MSSKRVVVAMSGGVDSAVTAALLAESGYEVLGVTMRMMPLEAESNSEQKLKPAEQDARNAASKLGIPHAVVDVTGPFSQCVVQDFVEEYRAGRTPNPCVKCNPEIKFATLTNYADEVGAEYIATGHYARVVLDEESGRYRLLRGLDASKDQSYVLYRLTQRELSRMILPLGSLKKTQVRSKAEELGLELAQKTESQDACFVPQGKYQDFLRQSVPDLVQPGPVVDTSGKVVGSHDGVAFFTVGQRRGMGVAAGRRLYVVEIDAPRNTVVVGDAADLEQSSVVIKDVNMISGEQLRDSVVLSAKIRYNTQDREAVARPLDPGWIELAFTQKQRAVTPGQSAVMYKGDDVLGGGIIADRCEARSALEKSGSV